MKRPPRGNYLRLKATRSLDGIDVRRTRALSAAPSSPREPGVILSKARRCRAAAAAAPETAPPRGGTRRVVRTPTGRGPHRTALHRRFIGWLWARRGSSPTGGGLVFAPFTVVVLWGVKCHPSLRPAIV